jgi:hypothetical protein
VCNLNKECYMMPCRLKLSVCACVQAAHADTAVPCRLVLSRSVPRPVSIRPTYAALSWRAGAPCPWQHPAAWPPPAPRTGSSRESATDHTATPWHRTCTAHDGTHHSTASQAQFVSAGPRLLPHSHTSKSASRPKTARTCSCHRAEQQSRCEPGQARSDKSGAGEEL